MYSSGAPGTMGPRRPRSPGGDGSYNANGVMSMPNSAGQNGTNQQPASGQPGQPGQPGQGQRPRWQTSHPPAAQSGGSAPPPTFAQMQASGQARPAPPQQQHPNFQNPQGPQNPQQPSPSAGASSFQGGSQFGQQPGMQGGVPGTLAQSVQQALQNPSAYGAPQVQDTFNMLNQSLGQGYDYQRKQLSDEMASRGLSSSSIVGQRYSDLATEQARAQANMATQLATQAAQTYGQDRSSAQSAGLGLGNLGVSQQAQDLARQLGVGTLGVAQQNANTGATSVANQYSLGQGQLGISQQAQDLAKQLGVGNLGVSQQNANTQQAGTMGQLGISQQAQDLARQLGLGQLGLGQQQLSLDQLKNSQQYGLQQADLTGTYNGQSTLASRAQQTAQQQFQQQLAQQLGLATMSDKTQNRGIDVQGQNQNNQLMMQLAMLGIGGNMASSVAAMASGAGGGGGGGSGSTNSNTNVPGATPLEQMLYQMAGSSTDRTKVANAESQWQQQSPQMYAQMELLYGGDGHGNFSPGQTFNFGGQTYTPKEYYTLMSQHPELFKPQSGNAAANADFFKNSTQQGGGQLASQQTPSYRPTYTPPDPFTGHQQLSNGRYLPTGYRADGNGNIIGPDGTVTPFADAQTMSADDVKAAAATGQPYATSSVGASNGGMTYQLGAQGTPGGTLFYRDAQGHAIPVPADKAAQLIQQQQQNPYAMSDADGINRFFLGQDTSSGQIYDQKSGRWIDPNNLMPDARAALMAQYGG